MSVYKFFRVIYGYHSDTDRPFILAKVQKPQVSSQVFINNDYGFSEEVEKEFSTCFDYSENLRLKKNAKQILKKTKIPEKPTKITDLLKICLLHSSKSKIKSNSF
jgi:hypothetical protein